MSNFDSLNIRVVNRIGNRIEQIIYWWRPYKNDVNTITVVYVKSKQNIILRADNPKKVLKFCAVDKQSCELNRIRANIRKDLSERDRRLISELNYEDFD